MEILIIVIFVLFGLFLFFVGVFRLSNLINVYFKNLGIIFVKEVDLLNEMRGVSGVMFMGGIFILLGIFLF